MSGLKIAGLNQITTKNLWFFTDHFLLGAFCRLGFAHSRCHLVQSSGQIHSWCGSRTYGRLTTTLHHTHTFEIQFPSPYKLYLFKFDKSKRRLTENNCVVRHNDNNHFSFDPKNSRKNDENIYDCCLSLLERPCVCVCFGNICVWGWLCVTTQVVLNWNLLELESRASHHPSRVSGRLAASASSAASIATITTAVSVWT